MSQTQVEKLPLDFNAYEQYGIAQNYIAFKVIIKNIDIHDADNFESEYQQQRYKIFHSDMKQNSDGTYELVLIIAQSSHTF